MNKQRIMNFGLLITLVISISFIPLLNSVKANDKPDYVGINENDVFIWKITIDKDPFEDYLEDYLEDVGLSDAFIEEFIDNMTDLIFDDEWDEDVKGWKMVILDIKNEKEFDYDNDENDQVPYLYNFYTTEDYDKKDWDKEEMNGRGGIAKYDKDFYVWRTDNPFGMGLYYGIVANNINWEKLADEVDEEFDDEWDGKDESAGARVAKSEYKNNGISTFWNPDEDKVDDFESTSQYNDDGVQMYYEWKYDGDPIIIMELEGQFFYEYWEAIIGVAILGVITIVAVVFIIKKIRERQHNNNNKIQ